MATYTFSIDGFNLKTTWKRMIQSSGPVSYDIVGASVTKEFAIDGITLADDEFIYRATLSATINRVGTTDYSEVITANDKTFASGTCQIDTADIVNGSTLTVDFYVRATGDAGQTGALNEAVSFECDVYFSDVVLTVTTGLRGDSFNGCIESLPDGAKLLIDEADGTALYTIVMHNYNDGKCLLWRDEILSNVSVNFNDNEDSFNKDYSSGSGSDDLDIYLENTFYASLPETTTQYIVAANYPTLTKRLYGEVVDLERHVCTPSVRELKGGVVGAAEGSVFNYTDTLISGDDYWTRSVYTGSSGQAYYINATGTSTYTSRGNTKGVRPAFAVLETQYVVQDGDYYRLSEKIINVKYYDGSNWVLAVAKYYNGSSWEIVNSVKYYDGTQWIE